MADVLDINGNLIEQLTGLKSLLTTILPSMVKSVTGGNIETYDINTGQTQQRVKVSSLEDLIKNYRNILALYNELCQHITGTNWVALRDESAFWHDGSNC